MAELVYAGDLKSLGEIHEGSSPSVGTMNLLIKHKVNYKGTTISIQRVDPLMDDYAKTIASILGSYGSKKKLTITEYGGTRTHWSWNDSD